MDALRAVRAVASVGDAWWAEWLGVLGCPSCGGAVRQPPNPDLICHDCGMRFPLQGQVPVLLRPADREPFAGYGQGYREAREREGWPALTAGQALGLPFRTPAGAPDTYWSVRRASYRRLARLLAREGPSPSAGPVADLGAGVGWLSFRLAQAGYCVLAVDASLDDAFGLGAAAPYRAACGNRLLVAQGDLEHPPLYRASWSAVVYNASLHYARDLAGSVARAARALRPNGRLIVLDTPIARRPVPGTGRGDRHLGRHELEQALAGAGLSVQWHTVCRGPRWWIYRSKAWLRRSAPFSFPIVVGERQNAGQAE